jgi:DNA-binding beta-propeller fold protein YncE
MRLRRAAVLLVSLATLSFRPGAAQDLYIWVASEAVDRIALLHFGPEGLRLLRQVEIGVLPTDPDGPHGLALSPDGRTLFVSTGHGAPFGYLWRLDPATLRVRDRVMLGLFPATLTASPDGRLVFVANFNLHGERVPSSVSVVYARGDTLLEVARLPTCTMPHGSRLAVTTGRHYSVCMHDDRLVEIDATRLRVTRTLPLGPGGHPDHGAGPAAPGAACAPTWAQPSPDGRWVYVACNGSQEILEVDAPAWAVRRRGPAGPGVYNLAVTPDGRWIVATNKRGQSVSLVEAATGREVARLPTRRRVPHGVVISPDGRYAVVSVEGVGSEPGTVEVLDLRQRRTVATADVGPMAGGIDLRPGPLPGAP